MAPNPALRISMAATLASWACVWILKPTQPWKRWWHDTEAWAAATPLGATGLDVAVLCLPVLAVATLGYVYLHLRSKDRRIRQRPALTAILSWPVILNSPFGILTGTELLFAALFLAFLAWTYASSIASDFKKLTPSKTLRLSRLQLKVLYIGVRIGSLSEACLALLLLPVLRGLGLFRIFGVQFEASVRYHIWIGNCLILLCFLHGAIIMFVWADTNVFWEQVIKWQRVGRVNLAGVVALVTGLTIWITSLPPIRRKSFNLFYFSHHLYAVFIMFFLLHAGDRHFYLVSSGVLLFALDKTLRIMQSSHVTSVVSARIMPGKVIELSLEKHESTRYTPTSIVFVKIPSISRFQWHPFSVTSSDNLDSDRLSLLVKCEGQWTGSLYNMIYSMASSGSSHIRNLPIAVEGPYGPANIPYQQYETLYLVAGGSGVTPFLSIIQDIHSKNKNSTTIQLIYVVKRSQDLSMLASVSSLLLKAAELGYLKLKIFVTQEEGSGVRAGELLEEMSKGNTVIMDRTSSPPKSVGLLWIAAVTGLSSLTFFASLICLSHIFVHKGKKSEKKDPSWISDLVVICSLVIAISCSVVATLLLARRNSDGDAYGTSKKHKAKEPQSEKLHLAAEEFEIGFGHRPNLIDILSELASKTEESNVGVFVCGPESMQRSVASFCRTSRGIYKGSNRRQKCIFSFHSINFSL